MNIDKFKNDPRMPKHIALIIDGNGRWAKRRGLPRSVGHKFGLDNLIKQIKFIQKLNVKNLSIYCFSTENWNRPKEEVNYLMNDLFNKMLDKFRVEYIEKDVRIKISGDIDDERIPDEIREKAKSLIRDTESKTGFILNPCINYGGRQEIVKAINDIISSGKKSITSVDFEKYLYTNDMLPLDLIIRTSGEMRSSNFMPWQTTYSEWYYTKTLWPSFDKSHLLRALKKYMRRNRRFGAIKG